MIKTELDESTQRQQIVQNVQMNENAFVEAGAGAGKTTLIVDRIIEQLKKGDSPEGIVVITFTNAAAEELRSRIILKVRESCKKEQDPQKKSNLKKALEGLDGMNISTIHSFCFRLLKERLFDAKLPMDVELLEESEASAMKERFFQEFIETFTKEDWRLLEEYEFRRSEAVNYIRSIFMAICELPDGIEIRYDKEAVGKSCTVIIKKLVEEFKAMFCQSAAALLGQPRVALSQIPPEMLIKREINKRTLAQILSEQEIPYFKTLKLIHTKKGKHDYFKKPRSFTIDSGKLDEVDRKCSEWVHDNTKTPSVEATIKLQEKYRYMTLVDYAVKARKVYREGRALRYLTNDDLLQKTHYLLCKSEYAKDAREYFAGKYSCFYVDEFQDTDSIQEEFIWKLAAELDDDTKLRPGSLFLVGDPKQSIYRFRGAEPEVYFKAKEKMAGLDNASVYYLGYNFRSNEEIISWVNTRFSGKKISAEPYRAMTATKKSAKQAGGMKLLAGVYHRSALDEKDKEAAADARNVAELIKELHDKEYLITEYKDGVAEPRKIMYSDFLLLCFRKKDMKLYLDALRKVGIPTLINGVIPLKENMALNTYARLFDYLTHPYAGMHSNSNEKRVGALEALRMAGHSEAEALLHTVTEAVRPARGDEMSPYGIADYLLHRLELLLPVNEEIKDWELNSVQTKLEQMYEKVLSRPCRNAEELSACFWEYINTDLERELPLEEAGNAVRLMNTHKAKGLEGNIVIILNRQDDATFSEGNLQKGSEYYPVVKFQKNTIWSSYRHLPEVKTFAEAQEREEKTRLAYVAATRAKQALIFMPALNKTCMFYDYDLQNNTADLRSILYQCRQNEPENTDGVSKEIVYDTYETADYIKAKDILKQPYIRKSPSSFEKPSETRRKAWEERKDNYKPDVSRPTGNIFGTVLHRSLQLLIDRWGTDFAQKPEQLEDVMKAAASQALMENRINIPAEEIELYRNYLSEILYNFAVKAYEEKLFVHALKVYTEIPFSFYDESYALPNEDERQKVWMNGTADLIVVDKEGNYLILDYKSDHDGYLTEEEFNKSVWEMYCEQLVQYRNAVQRLFEVSSDKIKLKIISFNGERQVRFTEMNP